MNVCFINSLRTFGGGERWLLEAAEGLAARGHAISVAARAQSALAGRARNAGYDIVELPMRGDVDPTSIIPLARWLRSTRCEVASVNVQRAVRVGAAAAHLAGVPGVVERRGLLFPVKDTALNRFTYRRLVTHVIANCSAIADDLAAGGVVPGERILIIPNGIEPERVAAGHGGRLRAELCLESDAPTVVIVGRLVPDKGHEVALAAFAKVVEREPRAQLLVVGAGKLMQQLRAQAGETLPEGSWRFLGHRSDIDSVLAAGSVVLVTSHREGMPHVVLEAMAAGTPIVATGVAGIPEMIEHGRDGLLVQPGDPDAAAEAVLRLLGDSDSAVAMAESARRRVREEFSLDIMIDRVETCFAAAAAGTRGR